MTATLKFDCSYVIMSKKLEFYYNQISFYRENGAHEHTKVSLINK